MEAALYAEIQLICVIITVLLLFWAARGGLHSQSQIWLFQMILCFAISFTAAFLATLFTRIISHQLTTLSFLFETLYHLFLTAGVFVWGIYTEVQYIGAEEHKTIRYMDTYVRPALPALLVILTNVFTKKLFYIDANGQVVEGILFHFEMAYLLICSGYYTFRLLKAANKVRDTMRRSHMAIASVFPVGILLGWLLSLIGHDYPVLCVVFTMGLLVLYLGSINFQVSMDWLTQVNNRQNLMAYLGHKLHNHHDDLYLMMLDVDRFKTINDEYGHVEGDIALTTVAGAIKRSCGAVLPRPYIARYGGDEFTVVLEAKSEEDVQELRKQIMESVKKSSEDRPYDLGISVGIAKYRKGQEAKELINEADEKLYEIKEGLKRES